MNFKVYQKLKKSYDSNDFGNLLKNSDGLLFLKIRSITRKELLIEFCQQIGIDSNKNTNLLIKEIANHLNTGKEIDRFIKSKFEIEKKNRRKYQEILISELYRLQVFNWGGLYQNNLERTIVDNYIKKIKKISVLLEKIDNEIHESLKGYVLCSWFNHWTSILIEDIFKEDINMYLNGFKKNNTLLKVIFNWKNAEYMAVSDALFIIK